ncbi:MAG: uroporphyrinogen decarboxylase family protein [Lentisphaerae bacterium]|nr:uroporphyrinogen decarboxylase family protein [Lentisphaerota bacterium]
MMTNLERLQATIERNGCNDIFEIAVRYPHKLYVGNVCCETTLPFGSVEDVEDEVLELLERIPGNGGAICIGSSSEIHDKIPVANAETLYHTVHEYGSLPIDLDRVRRRRTELRPRLQVRRTQPGDAPPRGESRPPTPAS